MGKDRRNISLDEEVNDAIDPAVVYSNLVEEWTRQYFLEGNLYNVEKAFLEQMLDQVEESREQMHNQVDEMHDELANELEQKIGHLETHGRNEAQQTGSGAQWEEAKDTLIQDGRVLSNDPQNDAIQNWAKKLNVAPAELITKLQEATT